VAALLGWLRRRWLMPRRLGLRPGIGLVQATAGRAAGSAAPAPGSTAAPLDLRGLGLGHANPPVGRQARELLLLLLALLPLTLAVGQALQVDPTGLLRWQALPALPPGGWPALRALPWPSLVGATLLLTGVAALLAVGLAPLQLLWAAPWPLARAAVRLGWALARLWPPPLTVLLLLFVLKPGPLPAALALGVHNGGILGRLLLESLEDRAAGASQALLGAGAGERLALLYGGLAPVARPYLAYGAYRADVMLRETVVVGLAGAAGLGSQLLESLSSFAWDQLAALLLVYAALTLLGEELSDRLRRRLLSSP